MTTDEQTYRDTTITVSADNAIATVAAIMAVLPVATVGWDL